MSKEKLPKRDIVSDLLNECLQIHADRDKQYGGSLNSFQDITNIANLISVSKTKFTTGDIATCMIATKIARYKYALNNINMPNRDAVIHDSLIDWINYVAICENIRILDIKEKSEPKFTDIEDDYEDEDEDDDEDGI